MRRSQHDIDVAVRHVREAEQRIVVQEARIDRLKREHQPTNLAEDLLRALQECRDLVKAHLGTLTDPDKPHNFSS